MQTSRLGKILVVVNVDWQVVLSTPVSITFNDRVGLYTSNVGGQLPVPFERDHTASLYYSTNVVASNAFTLSQRITLDNQRWTRSFRKHVVFCRTSGRRPVQSRSNRFLSFCCSSLFVLLSHLTEFYSSL